MSDARAVPVETTVQVRDTCLCLHAQRAARVLARQFDEALRPLGLTSGQFSLLNALNRPAPAPVGAVAALLAMDRTTLTAALKPLERRGLIRASADPDDRRSRLVSLTPAGETVLSQAIPVWRAAHGALERDLGEIDPERLRQGLNALAARRSHPSTSKGDEVDG
jgi:DNA-binding MarR family transcriptional regulator